MDKYLLARSIWVSSLVLTLAACGSGGGSKSNPPPPVTPPPATPPPTTPPPTTPPPSIPQPAFNAHLALTNADAARAAGLNGTGYRIGVVDSGVNRNHSTLAGRVVANYSYIDPARNNLQVDDVVGHGTTVAQLAAGAAAGQWPGGIAPGAQIVSARIINDQRPTDDGSGKGNEVNGALGFAWLHQDLINAGVRIMNNSWGGLYWTNLNATAPIAAEYRPFIVGNDGLVVFATGNEGRANPSDMAALPSQPGPGGSLPAADLQRGWLAVAALDTANPDRLASYSNACGIAKSYCLVAPGTVMFVGPNSVGGDLGYYYGSGTSYAAPLVSGAAALVWQAFPYFNNDLVRQTLLGTATDLGAAGPDEVFGYGLLNIGKAIKGPGRFDWGDVTVTLDGSSTWSNAISGSGGLIKRGKGVLDLSGANTYAGATRIENGALVLRDGASLSSNVMIAAAPGGPANAALQFGTGTTRIKGNVDNHASVVLHEADINATIDGDYLQQAGSRFVVALGANALSITGTATLRGGNVHIDSILSGYVPRDGRSQTLLQANQGVSGQFSGISDSLMPGTLLQTSLGYDANKAWLNIERIDVTKASAQLGVGALAQASAVRVEAAFDALDSGTVDLGGGFAGAAAQLQRVNGAAALQASLDSLSGRAHAQAAAMTFDSIDLNRRALSAHFGEGVGRVPPTGNWSRVLGGLGQGSYAGSETALGGWMMGSDYRLGEFSSLGFAFGETRASSTGVGSLDRGRDRQSQAQVFAGWSQHGNYALAQFGAGRYQRQLDRRLLLGADSYGVASNYSGRFLNASVELGHRFGTAAAHITPYLGGEHSRIDNGAFNEAGGFGFGLRSAASTASRTQALAGVRGDHAWANLSLSAYAEWQQSLSSSGLMPDASFVGVDAWAPLSGVQMARAAGLVGISVDSWLSRNSLLSFGYDQRFGPRGGNRQFGLRYRYAF